ncbi:MAG: galactosyldiacylglycerol synthase [Armatimonadetes bacterium]|nr:galactosyldiacylglycerol synthase [Armatimonadota bacterium]
MRLYNKQTGALLGEITPAQLQFLQEQMEEDSLDDHDYYINESELLDFEEAGADPALIGMLRQGLDENGELDIRWAED